MRRVTQSITTAAGGAGTVTNVPTPDDNQTRTLRHVFLSPATQGVILYILRAGFQLEQIDASRFASGNELVVVDEQYPALIPLSIQIANTTGGSYTGACVLAYEPGATPGSRPSPATPTL